MPEIALNPPPFNPVWEKGAGGMRGKGAHAGETPAHPAHTSGAHASGAYPGRDAPAPQGLPRAQGGLQPAPSLVLLIRTPKRPLLPAWEKGVAHRGRFFGKLLRAIFRFRLQDAPTPPSHLVGEGGWGDEGANVHTRDTRAPGANPSVCAPFQG